MIQPNEHVHYTGPREKQSHVRDVIDLAGRMNPSLEVCLLEV